MAVPWLPRDVTSEAVALTLLQEDASSGPDRLFSEGFGPSHGNGISFGSPLAYGTDWGSSLSQAFFSLL